MKHIDAIVDDRHHRVVAVLRIVVTLEVLVGGDARR